jgi:hypothetical protein
MLHAPIIPFPVNRTPRREPCLTPDEKRLTTAIVRLYRLWPEAAFTIERLIECFEERLAGPRGGGVEKGGA